jgi:hypothetical protein
MRKIIETDQSRPGICTEAGLAQTQFHLSEILRLRAEEANVGEEEPRRPSEAVFTLLEESAILAQRARKVLLEPHPLEPLTKGTGEHGGQQLDAAASLPMGPNGIPREHELALFDHLQPVFDGRFTGLHLLQYLGDNGFRL